MYRLVCGLMVMFALLGQAEAKTIKIVTEGHYPPWNNIDEEGRLFGYDIDVARAVCKEAQLTCDISAQNWDSIISSIRFKKFDVIFASMTDNPDRRRVIDFSIRYAIASTQIVTLAGNTEEVRFCQSCANELDIDQAVDEALLRDEFLKAFSGRKIAVQRNTVPFRYLSDNKELNSLIDVVHYDTMEGTLDAVVRGEAVAAIGDTSYLIEYLKTNTDLPLLRVGPEIIGKTFGKGIAAGLRKEDTELKQAISKAISKLKNDGTLLALSRKWFGYDLSPME